MYLIDANVSNNYKCIFYMQMYLTDTNANVSYRYKMYLIDAKAQIQIYLTDTNVSQLNIYFIDTNIFCSHKCISYKCILQSQMYRTDTKVSATTEHHQIIKHKHIKANAKKNWKNILISTIKCETILGAFIFNF